ncbi:hypothetical protein C8F04DRAFT_980718 [Mycena alexandri]|uniref:Uncharacterized protein n=1 Tax=Mycena alexandri TaxID=1745969 RepID=A0AAD6RWI8_9AGAR|nr:hypothetical protein C8F04DRAFT_980718 [Mycena alexandri]
MPSGTQGRGRGRGRRQGGARAGGGRRRGGKGKGGGQAVVGDDDVPKWATDAHVTLLAGGGGDIWVKVVELWWNYEKAARFVGPSKGKGTAKRPKEVSGWINRARTGGPSPAIIDVFSFASRWWGWWVEINPAWRIRTVANRLEKGGEGDWDSVASTGPNGMLNVLICLRWWYDALAGDDTAMAGWKEALEDVEWALEHIW